MKNVSPLNFSPLPSHLCTLVLDSPTLRNNTMYPIKDPHNFTKFYQVTPSASDVPVGISPNYPISPYNGSHPFQALSWWISSALSLLSTCPSCIVATRTVRLCGKVDKMFCKIINFAKTKGNICLRNQWFHTAARPLSALTGILIKHHLLCGKIRSNLFEFRWAKSTGMDTGQVGDILSEVVHEISFQLSSILKWLSWQCAQLPFPTSRCASWNAAHLCIQVTQPFPRLAHLGVLQNRN